MNLKRSASRVLETAGMYSNRWSVDNLGSKIKVAQHNLESLHQLPELGLPFIPQTSFALTASAIRIILNDLVLNDRRCVVELGSGISTLFLAKVMSQRPESRLISVDHDAEWIELVRGLARAIGCESVVQFVHAPLSNSTVNGAARWYDRDVMADLLASLPSQRIDSVIVDGPKAKGFDDDETRSYALPLLRPHLNPAGAIVFLDDVGRRGERRIYDTWARTLSMEQLPVAEFCGLGILVPSDRPLRRTIV